MTPARVLIACVGNIFLGDDAFGVEVARALSRRELPEGVRVVDFGIRGLDLTYALLDNHEAVILVDAAPRGGAPGTLYVIEPGADAVAGPGDTGVVVGAHGMDPVKVLRAAAAMGAEVERVLLVGCEPERPPETDDDLRDGLSEPVRAAVGEAVVLIESLAARLLRGEGAGAGGDNIIPGQEVGPCRD